MTSSTNVKGQQSSSHRRSTLVVAIPVLLLFVLSIFKKEVQYKKQKEQHRSSSSNTVIMTSTSTSTATSTTSKVPYKDAGDWSSTWWFPEVATEAQIGKQVAIESSSILPHLIYIPEKKKETSRGDEDQEKTPLIVFLHGQGESQPTELRKVALQGPPQQAGRFGLSPFAVLSPQKRMRSEFYDEDTAPKIIELIDHYLKKYNLDKSRVYLTGLSQGGIGTWNLAADEKYSKRFAAIAPVCGGLRRHGMKRSAQVLSDTPIYAVHGKNDVILPVSMSRESVKACRAVSQKSRTEYAGEITYLEIENAAGSDYGWKATTDLASLHMEGHASWIDAYYPDGETFILLPGGEQQQQLLPPLYQWFLKHKREL